MDPIEGGTANAYVYATDPINLNDYTGKATCSQLMGAICGVLFKNLKGDITPKGPLSLPVSSTVRPSRAPAVSAPKRAARTATVNGYDVTRIAQAPKGVWGIPPERLLPGPAIKFNLYNAASSANDYYNVGKVVGGGIGCGVGGLMTFQSGGWGCLVGGPTMSVIMGAGAGVWGFIAGGLDSPGADALEGVPDMSTGFEYNR